MLIEVFGILCGFTLASCAAASRPGIFGPAIAAAAAMLAWIVIPAGSLPDPVWGAIAALTLSGLLLWRPSLNALAAVGAGVAAAAWLALLVGQGLPVAAGFAVVFVVAATAYAFRWRSPRFASAVLVEEALLITALLAILVACWPAVADGYRSALVFTAERVSAPSASRAPWVLELSLSLLMLGGLYGWWKRR